MANEEKRIHELVETADKTGKFIALDDAGLSEALKYNADLLVDKAYTDTLYVKLVGDETVNGVKTWNDQQIFGAGIDITAGSLNVESGSQLIKAGKLGIGVSSNTYKLEVYENAAAEIANFINVHASGSGVGIKAATGTNYILRLKDNSDNIRFITRADGKTGIGTGSPETLVHIYSASDAPLTIESTTDSPYIAFRKGGIDQFSIVLESNTPAYGG